MQVCLCPDRSWQGQGCGRSRVRRHGEDWNQRVTVTTSCGLIETGVYFEDFGGLWEEERHNQFYTVTESLCTCPGCRLRPRQKQKDQLGGHVKIHTRIYVHFDQKYNSTGTEKRSNVDMFEQSPQNLPADVACEKGFKAWATRRNSISVVLLKTGKAAGGTRIEREGYHWSQLQWCWDWEI